METRLIEGVPPLPNDMALLAIIESKSDPYGGGGKPMDIALLGPDDRLYRAVRAWGMGEYVRITNGLLEAGLVNTGRRLTQFGVTFDDVFAPPAH